MGLLDDDDDDDNLPTTDCMIKTWGLGIIAAALLAYYAWTCISTQNATWRVGSRGHGRELEIHGTAAVGLGIFYTGIASLLHFHYFWAWRERFHGFAKIGIIASLVGAAIGMITFIYNSFGMWAKFFF